MRSEGGSPNLINGVSRQPPEVRLPSQLEESLNLFPTVSQGLKPRNPAEHVAALPGFPQNSFFHFIDRDDNEKYVVSVDGNGVRVADLAGIGRTVNAPAGLGYLAGASKDSIKAVTVADHTFILNTSKVVEMSPDLSLKRLPEALIHVAYASYAKSYTVSINGTVVANIKTPGGTFSQEGAARVAEQVTTTTTIAASLATGFGAGGGEQFIQVEKHLGQTLPASDWSVQVYDYVIHIMNLKGAEFSISCASGSTDASGQEGLRAHKEVVSDFSLLPDKSPGGFSIRVAGSEDTNYDDYHVFYDRGPADGLGRWKETLKQGIKTSLNVSTMPHVLRREADGSFTFAPGNWEPRTKGDDDTNPPPSFVGNSLSGLVFYKNRIGFTWGETVVLSRNGEFYNFWVESAQTQLDTDPIDVAISYPDISTIFSVVPLGGELALFTSSVPFRLGGGDILTPTSVNIQPLISTKTRSRARPVGIGAGCYFADDLPSGANVQELLYSSDTGQAKASSVSEHVNGYLPGSVAELLGNESLRTVIAWSPEKAASYWVYKWLTVSNERPQSAWGEWALPGPILASRIIQDWLYVIGVFAGSVRLCRIKLHEAWGDRDGVSILLDLRVEPTKSYDASAQRTTFTFPYNASSAALVVAEGDYFGEQLEGTVTGSSVSVKGDWTGSKVYGGIPYEASGILSRIVPRRERQDGAGTAVPGVLLTVASLTFDTGPSAGLDVSVERSYRRPYVARLRPWAIGTKTGALGSAPLGKVQGRVSVMAKAEDVAIRFRNSGPLGYAILSYQWTGDVSPKGY